MIKEEYYDRWDDYYGEVVPAPDFFGGADSDGKWLFGQGILRRVKTWDAGAL